LHVERPDAQRALTGHADQSKDLGQYMVEIRAAPGPASAHLAAELPRLRHFAVAPYD
jgi:hypothetical protein